ncbi:MAG: endonuclease/exonuclease/phosphatase family protein [Planctomycetes bacterium]|nr:endonuclease/exonuclease/phosphatase family protein [Planctomycetota bacterium]
MRLVSYNIHKGIGGRDRLYRLERIVRVLEHEQPDILCLQEVDQGVRRSRFDDQPELLARHFGFAGKLFQLNHRLKSGGYGNLVLSRWPIVHHHQFSIRMGGKKNRGAQVAVLNTPGGPLRLVNWHLGLAEAERQWQVRQVLQDKRFSQWADTATLLVGDFNDWRNSLSRGVLGGGEFVQFTSPPSRFRTFPAWLPIGALDKAFGCARIRPERAHVVASRLARVASDHLPLVLDFEVAPRAQAADDKDTDWRDGKGKG